MTVLALALAAWIVTGTISLCPWRRRWRCGHGGGGGGHGGGGHSGGGHHGGGHYGGGYHRGGYYHNGYGRRRILSGLLLRFWLLRLSRLRVRLRLSGYGNGYAYPYYNSGYTYTYPAYTYDYSVYPAASPSQGRYLGIDEQAVADSAGPGMKVMRVYPGSPAEQAGLQPGDVILSANGYLTQQHGNLAWIIATVPANGVLQMNVRTASDGAVHSLSARLP